VVWLIGIKLKRWGTRGRLCMLSFLCNLKSLHIGITCLLDCSHFIATLVWEVRSSPKSTQSWLQSTLRCVYKSGSHYTPCWTWYCKVFPPRSRCVIGEDILRISFLLSSAGIQDRGRRKQKKHFLVCFDVRHALDRMTSYYTYLARLFFM